MLDNGENVSAEQLEDRFANEHGVKEVVCYGEGNAIVAEVFLDADYLKTNRITLRPVSGKVQLENAQIIKRLMEVIA